MSRHSAPEPVEPEPEYEYQDLDSNEKQPWWNDSDKMGGLTATIIFLVVLAALTALLVKFLLWLF